MKYTAVTLILFFLITISSISHSAYQSEVLNVRANHLIPTLQDDPDKVEVERVIRESQLFETLTLYTNPKSFDKDQLSKYWVPIDQGGEAIKQVEANVRNLLNKRQHYGKESKNVTLAILSVDINPARDYADVQTRERWFIPLYDENEVRVPNRPPYYEGNPIDYTLRKIEGRWLIQSNSTPSRGKG
jgi:hypothetical protein